MGYIDSGWPFLPIRFPGCGGFFGDCYDAFMTFDPAQKVPDVAAPVLDRWFD